jgi:hypothetical protein
MEPRLFTSIIERSDGWLSVSVDIWRRGLPGEHWWFGAYAMRERARHAVSLANEFLSGVLRRRGTVQERDIADTYWLVERTPTAVIGDWSTMVAYAY